MSKLFSERLNNLQKEFDKIQDLDKRLQDLDKRLNDYETRLSECEAKINQLIDEITPILTQHANALKEILATVRAPASRESGKRSRHMFDST